MKKTVSRRKNGSRPCKSWACGTRDEISAIQAPGIDGDGAAEGDQMVAIPRGVKPPCARPLFTHVLPDEPARHRRRLSFGHRAAASQQHESNAAGKGKMQQHHCRWLLLPTGREAKWSSAALIMRTTLIRRDEHRRGLRFPALYSALKTSCEKRSVKEMDKSIRAGGRIKWTVLKASGQKARLTTADWECSTAWNPQLTCCLEEETRISKKCYIFEGNISLSVGEPESEALGIVGLTCLIWEFYYYVSKWARQRQLNESTDICWCSQERKWRHCSSSLEYRYDVCRTVPEACIQFFIFVNNLLSWVE